MDAGLSEVAVPVFNQKLAVAVRMGIQYGAYDGDEFV